MLKLYAETLFDARAQSAAPRNDFQIPRKNGTYNTTRQGQHTQRPDNSARDESDFRSEHIATSSSTYFRHEKYYPRSFLWRVVGNERILEIQPADCSRTDRSASDANLLLRFEFQDPILPQCVGLADSASSDILHVFVCTNRNEIFDLRLPSEIFRHSNSNHEDISNLYNVVDVSSLTIDTVHQLHVSNPNEIFVAFVGGRIQRIHRRGDQETWSQDNYDDSTWSATFRGMVGRRGMQHIEHGTKRLALSAVQGMVASQDTTYLYTLCLNHTLRVWQLSTGRLVETRDLLDAAREPNERLQLNPAEPGLIRLVTFPKRVSQTLVTYSPHEGGQFKFWDVRGGLTGDLEIKDRFPQITLNPPDPDPTGNTVWSLVSFELIPGKKDSPSQMWLLWRNNNYHQVYTLHFDDILSVPEAWTTSWVTVEKARRTTHGPDVVLGDARDAASKWLEFVFYPHRYSREVLETALSRYQEITGTTLSASQRTKSLKERLSLCIAASVMLRKYDNSELDYDRFLLDTDHQWRNFWRILESMNEERNAPLTLAFDPISNMAWICMTDACAAIRECSRIELLQHNDSDALVRSDDLIAAQWPHRKVVDDGQLFENMGTVLQAAHKFRRSFSPELAYDFLRTVEEELNNESDVSTAERIVLIFNQVGFSDGLSEGAEQKLLEDLAPLGGMGGLTNGLIFSILKMMANHQSKRTNSTMVTTAFGLNLLGVALLDVIEATHAILLDLLVLVVFIDESDDFDPPELFDYLLSALRDQHRNLWLSTHFRAAATNSAIGKVGAGNNSPSTSFIKPTVPPTSIMDDIFVKNIRIQAPDTRPLMYVLTETIAEIQKWVCGNDTVTYENATVHIQCELLANNNIELATSFDRFQPSTAWSSYVKGRLRLLRAEFTEALTYFRKASYTMSYGKAIGNVKEMSAGLLSMIDADHFNNGSSRYWQHVMELFEGKHSFSHAAEAARLALQGLPAGQHDPMHGFRSDVSSRLFTAELKCAKFEAAFDALVQLSDLALQKTLAVALADAILDPELSASNALGALSYLRQLPWSLHPHLATHVDQHLSILAKQQSSIPGASPHWNSNSNVDYLSILYAYRLYRHDYRGATSVLFDRLRIIRRSGKVRNDPQATALRHALLALINAMTNVASEEAFIIADNDDATNTTTGPKRIRPQQQQAQEQQPRKRRRMVITLDDLRREYQQVLDRCSRIERGDFDFEAMDESDDEQEESRVNGSRSEADAMEL